MVSYKSKEFYGKAVLLKIQIHVETKSEYTEYYIFILLINVFLISHYSNMLGLQFYHCKLVCKNVQKGQHKNLLFLICHHHLICQTSGDRYCPLGDPILREILPIIHIVQVCSFYFVDLHVPSLA